jgi:hypothetical protein
METQQKRSASVSFRMETQQDILELVSCLWKSNANFGTGSLLNETQQKQRNQLASRENKIKSAETSCTWKSK